MREVYSARILKTVWGELNKRHPTVIEGGGDTLPKSWEMRKVMNPTSCMPYHTIWRASQVSPQYYVHDE